MAKLRIPAFLSGGRKEIQAKASRLANPPKGRKRKRIFIVYKGKEYTLHDLAEKIDVDYMTMYMRYHTAPKDKRNYKSLVAPRKMGRPA